MYEDDYRKKLLSSDPNAFIQSDVSGVDSALK